MEYNGGKAIIIAHITKIDQDGTPEVCEWSVFGIRNEMGCATFEFVMVRNHVIQDTYIRRHIVRFNCGSAIAILSFFLE